MGMRVNPVNLVKVGVDGMEVGKIAQVLTEVVATLRRTEHLGHCQVMSVLFAQDLDTWAKRKKLDAVRKVLVELREFNPASKEIRRRSTSCPMPSIRCATFGRRLPVHRRIQGFPAVARRSRRFAGRHDSTFIHVNELFEHRKYFPNIAANVTKTNQSVIKAMVDVTADSGANAIMIDTSILTKVSNICLIDTSARDEMVDINSSSCRRTEWRCKGFCRSRT